MHLNTQELSFSPITSDSHTVNEKGKWLEFEEVSVNISLAICKTSILAQRRLK